MDNYTILVVLWILAVHYIADFLFQTHWQASNKSKDWWALGEHVSTYALALFAMAGLPFYWLKIMSLDNAVFFYILNYLLHFIVDAVTSRINTKLWNAKQVHWFFASVGFDQFLHVVCLLGVFKLFANNP